MSTPTLLELCDGATPGPWLTSAHCVYSEHGNVCAASEPRATEHVMFTPPSIQSKDLREAHANAQLIARMSPEVCRRTWELLALLYDLEKDGDITERISTIMHLLNGKDTPQDGK